MKTKLRNVLFAIAIIALYSNAISTPVYAGETHTVVSNADELLQQLFNRFIPEYKALGNPDFDYSYVENFRTIQDLPGISRQEDFFGRYKNNLLTLPKNDLSHEFRYQYDALLYEIEFNLERLILERRFRENHSDQPIPSDGLFRLPDSPQWYSLYIKRWTSSSMTPEDIFAFGVEEVARIVSEYRKLQTQLGYEGRDREFFAHLNSSSFFITDPLELVTKLKNARDVAQMNLGHLFEDTDVPPVGITPIENPNKDTPPGYYSKGVFYYNFFNDRFPKRALDWLFIHEAVPGHHYQNVVGQKNRPPIAQLFWYPGYSEGWGAYSEDLGETIGFYQDPYQLLGKWEWDMVRSIRLAIDVGIHFKGWTKSEALAFWRDHIPNQDAIAEREVDRIIRWPVQVMSYKIGEREFLELKSICTENQGHKFDIKKFHSLVLKRGSIPLPVLHDLVLEDCR